MLGMSIFVGIFGAQKRTPRVGLSFLVSLLLHGLALLYLGSQIFTTGNLNNAGPPVVISLVLRPQPTIERSSKPRPSKPKPSTLVQSRSLGHGVGERTQLESSPSGAVQVVEESGSKSIDIEAAYRIARQSAKSRPGLVESQVASLAPPALEQETPLGRSMSKSARKSCLTAHAGLGLLALPVLIASAVTDTGCKW